MSKIKETTNTNFESLAPGASIDNKQNSPTSESKKEIGFQGRQIAAGKARSNHQGFWGGVVGASIVLILIVFVAWIYPGYHVSSYYINEDPSLLTSLLSVDLTGQDSTIIAQAINRESLNRKDLIEDLLVQHSIVSSDEFASNISGYYNTLIAVLSSLLIIINLFGFFSWRSNANVNLEQKQKEIEYAINSIDKSLEDKVEDVFKKNLVVREKLEGIIQDIVDQEDHLSDEEWDKIHLLLKQYDKEEFLKAIKLDDNNDGSIEVK